MKKLFLLVFLLIPTTAHAQFFFDNFESGWGQYQQSPDTTPLPNTSIVTGNSNYAGTETGTHAAQGTYPGCSTCTDFGGFSVLRTGQATLPLHFKVQWDMKFSSPFKFPNGQKMWRSFPSFSSGQLPDDPGINMQLNFVGTSWSLESFSNSSALGNVETLCRGNITQPSLNVWHRIEARVKSNTFSGTAPNNDGELEVIWDGTQVASCTGRRINANSTRWLKDYWVGPGNYTSLGDPLPAGSTNIIQMDNFKITDLTGGLSSTTTTVSAPSVIYPNNAVVTATIASGGGTPTGTVSLSVDGGASTTVTLVAGVGTFTLGGLAIGNHSLAATYPAQSTFGASNQTVNVPLIVRPQTQMGGAVKFSGDVKVK